MIKFSWLDIESLVTTICNKVMEAYGTDLTICPIPRGGLIPGVMISHQLPAQVISDQAPPPGSKILLVDDILETGDTMREWAEHWEQYKVEILSAALVWKPKGSGTYLANFFGKKVPDDWILFPWESEANADFDRQIYEQNREQYKNRSPE